MDDIDDRVARFVRQKEQEAARRQLETQLFAALAAPQHPQHQEALEAVNGHTEIPHLGPYPGPAVEGSGQ